MKSTAKYVFLTDSLGDSSDIWQICDKMSVWENYKVFDIIFGITLFSVYSNLEYFTLDRRSDTRNEPEINLDTRNELEINQCSYQN